MKLKKEDSGDFWTAVDKFLRTIWRRNNIEGMAARLSYKNKCGELSSSVAGGAKPGRTRSSHGPFASQL